MGLGRRYRCTPLNQVRSHWWTPLPPWNESSDLSSMPRAKGTRHCRPLQPCAWHSLWIRVGSRVGKKPRRTRFKRIKRSSKACGDGPSVLPIPSVGTDGSSAVIECVINVCHRPRLNTKAKINIITHLAICASNDWNRVYRIVVGNFVTASQTQRKWYAKIYREGVEGDYKLGAVRVFVRWGFSMLIFFVSLREYYYSNSDGGSARGGENASLRTAGYSSPVQRSDE